MQQINWTEWAGLTGFGLAAIANARAGTQRSRRGNRSRRPWLVLSLLYALLCVELVANTRHTLLRVIGKTVGLTEFYGSRQPGQLVMLAVLGIGAILAIWRINVSTRDRPWLGGAAIIALCVAGLFAVEIVSFHPIAPLLYHRIGPVMLIGWLWLSYGLTATGIALAAPLPPLPPEEGGRHKAPGG